MVNKIPSDRLLDDCCILLAGTRSGLTHAQLAIQIQSHGGTVTLDAQDLNLTHTVILAAGSLSSKKVAQITRRKEQGALIHVLHVEWLLDSVKAGKLLDEGLYAPCNSKVRETTLLEGVEPPQAIRTASKLVDNAPIIDIPFAVAAAAAPGQATAAQTSQCPVDPMCSVKDHAHVVRDGNAFYDAKLTLTDAKKNSNKFFVLQVLRDDDRPDRFYTWIRWGRIGEHGRESLLVFTSSHAAVTPFQEKFEAKTGLAWSKRSEPPIRGKYTWNLPAYTSVNDDYDGQGDKVASVSKSHLPEQVQSLMRFIFDEALARSTLKSVKFDDEKLPLGRVSTEMLDHGQQMLDRLRDSIVSTAKRKAAVAELTNEFYTAIPHSFGRARPPLLDTHVKIQQEMALVQVLRDLKVTHELRAGMDSAVHPIDATFAKLGLRKLAPVERDSSTFATLSQFVQNTADPASPYLLDLTECFEVELASDQQTSRSKADDRRLLFVGARANQFGAILKDGLGALMAQKGNKADAQVRLSPVLTKATQACYHKLSGDEGLVLVIEAQLEANERRWSLNRGTNRTEWTEASGLSGDLSDVKVPARLVKNERAGSALYDEFQFTDLALLRAVYLLRLRFTNARASYY